MSSIGLGHDTGTLPSEGELLGISMTADGHGWLWTNDRLYATSDGGRTWSAMKTQPGIPQLVVAARIVSAQAGFAILTDGSNRTLARTEDGGKSWFGLPRFPDHV
jgi:photosystem II stability/assembly factor-like uncharacterized protein